MSPAILLPVLVVLSAVPVPVLSVLSIMAMLPVGIAAPMLAPVVVGERRRARQQERGAERPDDLVGHFFYALSKPASGPGDRCYVRDAAALPGAPTMPYPPRLPSRAPHLTLPQPPA